MVPFAFANFLQVPLRQKPQDDIGDYLGLRHDRYGHLVLNAVSAQGAGLALASSKSIGATLSRFRGNDPSAVLVRLLFETLYVGRCLG